MIRTSAEVNINLTPEQERIVKDELEVGHFRSVEEVIGAALLALLEVHASDLRASEVVDVIDDALHALRQKEQESSH